jgi:hypothetical protein
MATIDLVGQCIAEIDHVYAVTITDLEVRKSVPTTVKKGALGPIGAAQGIADYTASFTLAYPKTGLEFNLEALAAKPGGFSFTYSAGVNRWTLAGCKIPEETLSGNQGQGDVSVRVSLTATDRIRQA